jgi:hypothetical protein
MSAAEILALVEKGLTLLPLLIQAGEEITPLVERLIKVAKGGADGTVTAEELRNLEADIDTDLDSFNAILT